VATASAEKLITSDGVTAIMGADCSGVTGAVASNVAVVNGVVMISPSATSPGLSQLEDKGLFFRTSPSDARQGDLIANVLFSKGIKDIAVTYTNSDYGKGLSDSFTTSFKGLGGKVTITAAHEDGKADYSAEVGALAAAGSSYLAVFGYADQGGKGIVQASLDADAFEYFVFGDGMFGQTLIDSFGTDINGSIAFVPGSENQGAVSFGQMMIANGMKEGGSFTGESYDAAALMALSMQASGSADRSKVHLKMLDVANAPGIKIMPGELAKGLKILKDGGEIDYVGATAVEFNAIGEVLGSYKEMVIKGGNYDLIKVH
jgi:branched-chain amino acid transport system substrate-binding protein